MYLNQIFADLEGKKDHNFCTKFNNSGHSGLWSAKMIKFVWSLAVNKLIKHN